MDAPEIGPSGRSQGTRQSGFSCAGHVLDEEVAFREQRDQSQSDGVIFAYQDLPYGIGKRPAQFGDIGSNRLRSVVHRAVRDRF